MEKYTDSIRKLYKLNELDEHHVQFKNYIKNIFKVLKTNEIIFGKKKIKVIDDTILINPTIFHLLTSMVSFIARDDTDIKNYYIGLNKSIPGCVDMGKYKPEEGINDSLNNILLYLSNKFDAVEYKKVKVKFNNGTYSNYFSDCVETTIRNFLDYTKDLISPLLKDDFSKFLTDTESTKHTIETQSDWATKLSFLPNITYKHDKKFELRAIADKNNFLKILQAITKEGSLPNWEKLIDILRERFEVNDTSSELIFSNLYPG